MTRKRMIAGNWKMNKLPSEAADFFPKFMESVNWDKDAVDVLFAVPNLHLDRLLDISEETGLKLAPQNVHWEKSGAFTGEISIPMIQDLGLGYALVGHSERRQYFNETDETVGKKVEALLKAGIKPIACVGEQLSDRESGNTETVITAQVNAILEVMPQWQDIVIAYEPVWAIGTGKTASNEQAQEAHSLIRRLFNAKFGDAAESLQILYGGSAKPSNIEGLLEQKDIDGALVGGASLKPDDFAAMVSTAS